MDVSPEFNQQPREVSRPDEAREVLLRDEIVEKEKTFQMSLVPMFQKEINTILARDEGAPIDVFANDDVLAWFGSYGDSFRLFCINNKAVHSRIATGTTTNEDMELIVNYLKANPVVDTLDISKYIH